jgi:histidinol-phosphate aminotransferase
MSVAARFPAQTIPPRLRAALAAIHPYEPGMTPALAAHRHGERTYAKLSSNENPYGPSPKAVQAAIHALAHPETYPDSTSAALRAAAAAHLGAPVERVIVGPGSEAIIDYVFRAYLSDGDALLLSRPTFPSYEIFARSAGAQILDVPRTADFAIDVAAVREALAKAPKAMALCTPNNPTGTRTSRADIAAILEATPPATLVLVDEAYAEFHDQPGALDLLEAWGGTFLLTRTFSKAYGLAGLRAGYGVVSHPEVIDAVERLRPAFNLTAPSQAAAVAALADPAHMRTGVEAVVAERERMQRRLAELGVAFSPSEANFIFVRAPIALEDAFDRFLAAGLIVRPIRFQSGWFRISVGLPAENDRVLAALAAMG